MCGLSRWNSIFRMTLVTLGSPGLRAGKSPDFLVLRGLARSGRSRVKVPGARILSRNVANARSACSGGKSRDRIGRGGQGMREADLVRAVAGEGARGEDLEQERGEREIGLLRGKKPRPYRSRRPGHAGS